jgi:hypothetical protein
MTKALLLAIVAAFALAACGRDEASKGPSTSPSTSTPPASSAPSTPPASGGGTTPSTPSPAPEAKKDAKSEKK